MPPPTTVWGRASGFPLLKHSGGEKGPAEWGGGRGERGGAGACKVYIYPCPVARLRQNVIRKPVKRQRP